MLLDTGHYRNGHFSRLSTRLWSRFADRVGENRVKRLRSKRRIARTDVTGLEGTPHPARPVCEGAFYCLIQINDGGRAPWQGLAVSRVAPLILLPIVLGQDRGIPY